MKREFQINFVYNDDPLAERWEGRFIDADNKEFTDFTDNTPFIQEFTDTLRFYIEEAFKPKDPPIKLLNFDEAMKADRVEIWWPDGKMGYFKVLQDKEGKIAYQKEWGQSIVSAFDLAERRGFPMYELPESSLRFPKE